MVDHPKDERQPTQPWMDATVSMFDTVRSNGVGKTGPLSRFLKAVADGKYAAQIADIRRMAAAGDAAGRTAAKAKLPSVTPGGRVRRAKAGQSELLEHSGVVVIDLDHVEDAAAVRDSLAVAGWTLAAFVSPSGYGVKVLAVVTPTPTTKDEHTAAWNACRAAVAAVVTAKVDGSGKDVTRLCLVSHDADAYTAATVTPLPWVMSATASAPASSPAPPAPMDSVHQTDLQALYMFVPPSEYNEWFAFLPILKALGFTVQEAKAWSSLGASYQSGEVQRRWEGLPTDDVEEARGNLYAKAKAAGWKVPRRKTSPSSQPPASAPPKTTDLHSGDYHHQGAATRILRHRATDLLAVKDNKDGGRVSLRVDDGRGVWRDDAEQLHMVHTYAMEAWEQEGMAAGVPLYAGGAVWRAFQTFKRGSLSDVGHKAALASVTGAIGVLENRGERPPTLTRAQVEDLDAQTRYLGCLNGVVDLRTGQLLDRAAAREALVTRRIPTAYVQLGERPEHPAVTAIRAHLSAAGLWDYTCALMGHTLWGQPNLFVYIVGDPEEGKTTLLTAIANTLGIGEEANRLAEAALAKDSRPTKGPDESQTALVDGRMAFAEEASAWNINCEKLKDASGDGPGIHINRKNEHVRTEPSRGTIWLAGNAAAHLDWDDALEARANLINWPALGSTGRTKDNSVKPESTEGGRQVSLLKRQKMLL